MPTWDRYFMTLAWVVASKSKDPSTKVGAVIVDDNNTIMSTGFNGMPMGVLDLPNRLVRPEKYRWVSHAEANAIYFAARGGRRLEGATMYITHHPCSQCANALIQSGIKRLIIGPGTTSMDEEDALCSDEKFKEAGIEREWSGITAASAMEFLCEALGTK